MTLLEEMNEAFRHNKLRKTSTTTVNPFIKAQLQKSVVRPTPNKKNGSVGYNSVDVALESALLALGRCMDLVRPAGTFTSRSVTRQEWKSALKQLEYFLDLMQRACDPDLPLPPNDWGKLSVENVTISSTLNPLTEVQEQAEQNNLN